MVYKEICNGFLIKILTFTKKRMITIFIAKRQGVNTFYLFFNIRRVNFPVTSKQ